MPYEWTHIYKPRWWEKSWKQTIINKRISKEKIMNFSDVDWYKRVSFSIWNMKKKMYLVHRLVFCTFNKIPLEFKWQKTKTLILHKNDIRDDNRLENLFLWDQKDNMKDMSLKWRQRRWIVNKIKIWYEDIPKIKEKYKELKNIHKVASIFWVSWATISRALNWKIWSK